MMGFAKGLALALLLTQTAGLGNNSDSKKAIAGKKVDAVLTDTWKDAPIRGAVMVRENGRTVFQHGYGYTDLRSQTPVNAQTNFRLASCTKQFTAMAIMLLVHDGKLRYDDRLRDVFPEFPEYGRAITIRNLLNHTSGLPDYEELMDKLSAGTARWTEDRQIQDSEVLRLLEGEPNGRFAAGTKWSYSNSGYVVLGLVVSKISGQPLDEFLKQRIFTPLKMNGTVAYVKGKNQVANRAYGHSQTNGTFNQSDQSSTSATLGDGGIYSNLEDLAKWDDALLHHTLLNETEMQPALVPVKLSDGSQPVWDSGPGDTDPQAGKPVLYGFGWFLDPYEGHARMWHYGDTIGFKSAIERFSDRNLTVIMLSNRADLDAPALATKVASVFLAKAK
jgi:CubicO group peptidase (beta-lactamase class C family)